jgi:hypothetical protein
LLMEEIDYSVLFRWFVGMNMDEPVWDAIFSPGVSGPRPTAVATSPSTAAARGLFGSSAHAFGEAGVGE